MEVGDWLWKNPELGFKEFKQVVSSAIIQGGEVRTDHDPGDEGREALDETNKIRIQFRRPACDVDRLKTASLGIGHHLGHSLRVHVLLPARGFFRRVSLRSRSLTPSGTEGRGPDWNSIWFPTRLGRFSLPPRPRWKRDSARYWTENGESLSISFLILPMCPSEGFDTGSYFQGTSKST